MSYCDACATARAQYIACKGDARLDLCGHHHGKHGLALVADGWSLKPIPAGAEVAPAGV